MLIEGRLEIAPARAEVWSAALLAHGDPRWSVFEDVDAKAARVCGYFADEGAARESWRALRRGLPRALRRPPEPVYHTLEDQDWRESYKAHFKPWRRGHLHWVPEWERATYRVPRGHVAVYLDPGMAFGTGNHETTRLCVQELVAFAKRLSPAERRKTSVIDAGCGSGILAISAAKLGFTHILAFDNDAEAVAVARANARRNGVASALRMRVGEVGTVLKRRRGGVVLANIQANVLTSCARELLAATNPGGRLVLSGILAREVDVVAEHFQHVGVAVRIVIRTLGEWASVTCRVIHKSGRRVTS